MPKVIGKYFLAIVPDEPIKGAITSLKEGLQASFGIKYALKSPPHITLKMPFVHNENKEKELLQTLGRFFLKEKSFSLSLGGIGAFGNRVVFMKVKYPPELKHCQERLRDFTKTVLKKNIELSDANYHPHMTLAFRDFKKDQFEPVIEYLKMNNIRYQFMVSQVALLKKVDGYWVVLEYIKLSS